MISYWIVISFIICFTVIALLCNYNVIFKNSCVGNFFKSPIFKYIVKRICLSLLSIIIIMLALFFLIRLMPHDYYTYDDMLFVYDTDLYLPKTNSLLVDLKEFFYNILPFPKKVCTVTNLYDNKLVCSKYKYKIINLGYSSSYMHNVGVFEIIKEKCSISFLIGIIAYLIQCIIGYPLGIYIAKKKGKLLDKSVNFTYVLLSSLPAILYFYLFLLIFLLAFKLPVSFDVNNYLSYIAPLSSVIIFGSITIAYWVKKYILLESEKDYVKFAVSKGLSSNRIFYNHIVRNALTPLIRTIPTSLALSLCGYYFLEATFNIPGIGFTLITAINSQDIFLVQGIILCFSFVSVFSYLLGDIIAILMDKRILMYKEVERNEK